MAISLPTVEILFKQLANSFVQRSERGVVILIVKDDTDETFTTKEYKDLKELANDSALYTSTNYQYIADVLGFGVNKVVVIRMDTTGLITDALVIVEKTIKTGWVTVVGETADYTALVTWIKSKETAGETYRAVIYNASIPNSKQIVNFGNLKVTFADTRGEVDGDNYLPSLAGILAACNVNKGSTYFKCNNLAKVEEVNDTNAALNAGKLVLINDIDSVKIGLGINSLTTFNENNTEDMRYIDTIEAMSLIRDDIKATFVNNYVGQCKNTLDNQILFISSVNSYLKMLADEDILDPEYKNYSDIDVVGQRNAWIAVKSEASSWSNAQVRNTTFKRNVYLSGDIKILGAMENLKFNINMF